MLGGAVTFGVGAGLLGPTVVNTMRSHAHEGATSVGVRSDLGYHVSDEPSVSALDGANGLAAILEMVLGWRHGTIPDDAREVIDALEAPRSLNQAAEPFHAVGFEVTLLTVEARALPRLRPPVVAPIATEHGLRWVLVRDVRQDYLYVLDPGRGNVVVPLDEFVDRWQRHVLAFSDPPTPNRGR